jgi:hypothetical protein
MPAGTMPACTMPSPSPPSRRARCGVHHPFGGCGAAVVGRPHRDRARCDRAAQPRCERGCPKLLLTPPARSRLFSVYVQSRSAPVGSHGVWRSPRVDTRRRRFAAALPSTHIVCALLRRPPDLCEGSERQHRDDVRRAIRHVRGRGRPRRGEDGRSRSEDAARWQAGRLWLALHHGRARDFACPGSAASWRASRWALTIHPPCCPR